jgi:protein-L-isoaspartate(D-aspartate) O-methyltransferase
MTAPDRAAYLAEMDERAALLDEIAQEMRETAHLTGRTALSPRVADALAKVKREAFVAPGSEPAAYENRPLPIGHGQTISQPFVVALMTELLDLRPGERVLEVGTGSGYQAAVLGRVADQVYSIEVIPELAARAAVALSSQGYANVELRTGDGGLGWPEQAPFDAIIVTAAAPDVPGALLEQLRPGGRMVIPAGPRHGDQELLLITKDTVGGVIRRSVLPVAFVPLTGGGRD